MAAIDDVLNAFRSLVQATLAPAPYSLPSAQVYAGWPDPNELQTDLRNRLAHVSIYPARHGDQPRKSAISGFQAKTSAVVTLTSTLSAVKLTGGAPGVAATGTVTFGGSVTAGNTMIFGILTGADRLTVAYVPTAGASLSAVAAGLAAAINGNAAVAAVLTASATGAVVTLRAVTAGTQGNAVHIDLMIGGTGTLSKELGRRRATIELHVWTWDNASRGLFANALDTVFADTNSLVLADGTWARVNYVRTTETDAEIKHGVYRRILQYTAEYVTTVDVSATQVLEGVTTVLGSKS